MAEICKSGDPVTWEAMASLATKFKNLGSQMGLLGYQPIADDEKSPFSVDTPEKITLALTYMISGGVIQRAYLAESLGGETAWEPKKYQDELIDAGDLIFISDQDDCLCRTMWQVVNNQDYMLRALSETSLGCCPTLELPQPGDSDSGHPFFPVLPPKAGSYSGFEIVPACVSMAGGAGVGYADGQIAVRQRELKGTLTWRIRKKFYEQLADEVAAMVVASGWLRNKPDLATYINGFAGSKCGASDWFPGPVPDGQEDCVRDVIAGILTQAFFTTTGTPISTIAPTFDEAWWDEPGCLQVANANPPDWTRPWVMPTCMAEDCEGDLRVYCNTMRWMHALVDAARYSICRSSGAAPTWEDVNVSAILLGAGGSITVVKGTGFGTSTVITVTLPAVCDETDSSVIVFIDVWSQCGSVKITPEFQGETGRAKFITGPNPEDCFDSSTPPDAWIVSGPDTLTVVGATPDSCDWCAEAAEASVLFGSLGEVELEAGGAFLSIDMNYNGLKPATQMVWTLTLAG